MEEAIHVLFAASLLFGCCWPRSMCAQSNVSFSLNGTTYQNNSLVTLENIGEGDDALLCLADLTACCRHPYTSEMGPAIGNWSFPNGTTLPSEITASGVKWDFYSTSGEMVKYMHRRRGGVTGIYSCVIPDAMNVTETVYIGVYTASTGQVTIPGEITFQLDTDLATDPPVFTLTCTSTGGPATTVSWRRDGTMLSEDSNRDIMSQVMDPVTATYTNTLTVTGRLAGQYECNVSNSRTPSGSTRSIRLGGGEGVRFSLNGTTYQNNDLVNLEDIGNIDDALLCITDVTTCCQHPYTGPNRPGIGNWFFPNGTSVLSDNNGYDVNGEAIEWGFYTTRGWMVVRLNRRRGGVTGIYHCEIPVLMGPPIVYKNVSIGIYTARTGQVTIPGEITFQLNTDPNTDPPVFTLTCTSTGGPATTVSWRRNGTVLSDDSNHDIMSQVADPVTATYTNTLTVTGRLAGQYQCSVSNSRTPSESTRSLTVVDADLPTNLNAVQVGSNSFRVSWTPPANVTGYRVYWSVGTHSGSVSTGCGDTTVTITRHGLTPGLTYDVTIVALSDHLPSPVVGPVTVALDYIRVSLRGTSYQNNSVVNLEDIGEGYDALLCIICCRSYTRNWFFPNGTRIPTSGLQWEFYSDYISSYVVYMHRRKGGMTGIYHCEILGTADIIQALYIGVYTPNTGQVTIPGEITFQLNTNPATDPPVFTLTCTSTGGPATTVSWRRDGTMLSDDSNHDIMSQVTDLVTATYTNTLTVTGRLAGQYECSVSNSRTPSGSTRSITVVAAGSPTNLNAVQVNVSSFRVSWTPPATVTGYRVYWSGVGGYDSGNIGAAAGDTAVTITGLTPRLTYSVTIVALSDHLPSSIVGTVTVALGYIRFSLRGITYQNNSLVTLEDIGEGDDALVCRTEQIGCCRSPYTGNFGPPIGNWFFPNGTGVPNSIIGDNIMWEFYRNRKNMVLNMHRRRGGENGIYHCEIPDTAGVYQIIHIGVYTAGAGQVAILGEIIFQLNTDPATDPPVFTLTCTSTGGPATTVSWRRNGTVLSDDSNHDIMSQVTDPVTATYTNTLTVTGRLAGQYECSVSNSRTPSGSTRSLAVVVANFPTNLKAVQIDSTSFRVSWTPPATVTGYRVYWSGSGGSDSSNMSVAAGDTAVTITGCISDLTYNVTIVALSDHLPSPVVGSVMVTLDYVRFSLRGTTYQINSLVTVEDIGEGDDALLCKTSLVACCEPFLGNWFFPNGTGLPSEIVNVTSGLQWEFYRDRGWTVVRMHRRRGGVTGIYHCEIPDTVGIIKSIYIGVYTTNTGQVTIPGEITFQLNTDPVTDPPVFTLTCTSTGGPATTVSWRRDGTMLSDDGNHDITSEVTDPVTATYTNTLTVTGRLAGQYQCNVSNSRTPSGSTRSITVVVANLPANLNAVKVNSSSFRVSWTPPATVTGYQVYWSGVGGCDSDNMSVGAGDTAVTITGLTPGLTYDVTIVALSDHLPSPVVGPVMITVWYTCSDVMESRSLVGAVVGACIGTALLYTVILLVSIGAVFLWNKRHRKTRKDDTKGAHLDTEIVMKKCDAYGGVIAHSETVMEAIYENPQ